MAFWSYFLSYFIFMIDKNWCQFVTFTHEEKYVNLAWKEN